MTCLPGEPRNDAGLHEYVELSERLGLEATRYIREGSVAWIVLNRPHAANTRNQAMRNELARLYDVVAADDDVRVVVLTGAGERTFCAGMDLKEASGPETPAERADRLRSSRDMDTLASLPKPTIAAVNGHALGGGCEMALACDLRIAADHASFGLPELTHGLVPGAGATVRLPRLIGPAKTLELLYLARRIDGMEAAHLGLANECVPGQQLAQRVREIAYTIAALSPAAVTRAKQLVRQGGLLPEQEALTLELDALIELLDARSSES